MKASEKIKLFKQVFRGRDDAYGFGDGQCVKKPVTDALISSHLKGECRIGQYPLSPKILNGEGVYWVASDIDSHGATGLDAFNDKHGSILGALYIAQKMAEKAAELGFRVFTERSKSGKGCHVFLFFSEPVKAIKGISLMRWLCEHVEQETGFSIAEIFPKQTQLTSGNSYGNYINLPCNGAGLVKQGFTAFFDPMTGITADNQWEVLADITRNMIKPDDLDMWIESGDVPEAKTVVDTTGHVRAVGVNYAAILSGKLSDAIGGRTDHLVRLAGHWWQRGDNVEEAIQQAKIWDTANELGLDADPQYAGQFGKLGKVEGTVRDIYRRNDKKAAEARKAVDEVKGSPLVPIETLYDDEFRNIIKAGHARRVRLFCMPKISDTIGDMRPGDVGIILARSGIGKSFLGHSIAHEVAKEKLMKAAFFSMEMSAELMISRSLQMSTGWDDKALEDMVMDDDDSTIKYRLNEYDGAFLISTKSVMTVEEIQQALMTDPDAGFAVIDYLGLIRSEGRSLYESVSKVARALKGVAKETNTAIMCLCQTRRIDKFTPVTLEMGRDTGVIEEGTDYLIGLWRDSPENAVIVAELLKNRRGKDSIRDHMIIRNHKLVAALVTEGDEGGSSNSGD